MRSKVIILFFKIERGYSGDSVLNRKKFNKIWRFGYQNKYLQTEILVKPVLNGLEGVNGVNRLATKGEKVLLTTDKTRKKLPTSDKQIN